MDEARASKALVSLELSVLSIPGVFENVVSRLSAADALRLFAACKALLSLPLPREHAITAALRACPLDVGSTTRAHRLFLFLSTAFFRRFLGLRWLLRVLLSRLNALRRALVRALGAGDGCGSCRGTLERCVRSLVCPSTGVLSLDGCDPRHAPYVLCAPLLCRGRGRCASHPLLGRSRRVPAPPSVRWRRQQRTRRPRRRRWRQRPD